MTYDLKLYSIPQAYHLLSTGKIEAEQLVDEIRRRHPALVSLPAERLQELDKVRDAAIGRVGDVSAAYVNGIILAHAIVNGIKPEYVSSQSTVDGVAEGSAAIKGSGVDSAAAQAVADDQQQRAISDGVRQLRAAMLFCY